MARSTLKDIAEAVKVQRPDFVVHYSSEDGTLTVLNADNGDAWVDVFLTGNSAETFYEGYSWGTKIRSIQDADKVAGEVIKRVSDLQEALDEQKTL